MRPMNNTLTDVVSFNTKRNGWSARTSIGGGFIAAPTP